MRDCDPCHRWTPRVYAYTLRHVAETIQLVASLAFRAGRLDIVMGIGLKTYYCIVCPSNIYFMRLPERQNTKQPSHSCATFSLCVSNVNSFCLTTSVRVAWKFKSTTILTQAENASTTPSRSSLVNVRCYSGKRWIPPSCRLRLDQRAAIRSLRLKVKKKGDTNQVKIIKHKNRPLEDEKSQTFRAPTRTPPHGRPEGTRQPQCLYGFLFHVSSLLYKELE